MVQRSIILIGRHGVAPKNADGSSRDSISDASIQAMYHEAREELLPLVQSLGITPQDTFIRGAGNIDYWLAHPTARTHDGEPIETYDSVSSRTRHGVQDVVRRVLDDEKRFGIVTSHATVVEPALIHVVNSGLSTHLKRVEDIGGMLAQEEHAKLVIDQTDAGTYTASLVIKGQEYSVDLQGLLSSPSKGTGVFK